MTTQPACGGPASNAQASDPKRPRVLIVEDQPLNRDMITRQLGHLGCTVELADDGIQACVAVMRSQFDLVFMDCQMPRVDGFQATRSIREHEKSHELRRTPIVALSASLLNHERDRCIAAGMDDFLSKPAPIAQLRSVIERWTGFAATMAREDTPPRPNSSEQVLDTAALSALRALRRPGRPNLVIDLIPDYLQSTPARIDQLVGELTASGTSRGDIAHGLKSISASLGAIELAQTLGRIEAAQRAGGTAQLASEVASLREQFARASAALEKILQAERQIEAGSA